MSRLPAALALLLFVAPASADEVILRDGRELIGDVLSDDDDPILRLAVDRDGARVVIEVPRDEVHWVRRLGSEDERLAERAEQHLLDGDVPAALESLEVLAQRRPDDPRALREYGFVLLLDNQDRAAVDVLARVSVLDPLDLEARIQLAQVLDRLDELDGAIEAYRQAAHLSPRHAVAWRGYVRLLLRRDQPGDLDDADLALDQALRQVPDDEALTLARVDLVLRRVDPQDPSLPKARQVLRDFLARVPEAQRAARRLAALDAKAGDHDAAVRRLTHLLDRPLGERELSDIAAERALFQWLATTPRPPAPDGMDVRDLDVDPALAARGLDHVLAQRPQDGDLLLARALAALRLEQPGSARGWLERATLAGPGRVSSDALLLQEVAVLLQRAAVIPGVPSPEAYLGDDASVPRTRRLVRLMPWAHQAHTALARALEREGSPAEAARAYEDAAGVASDDGLRASLEAEAERLR